MAAMSTDLLSDFSRRLRILREEIGLDPRHMAELLGVSKSRYQNWERGDNFPHAPEANTIVETCGVTLDWLMRGNYDGLPMARAIALKAREHGLKPPVVPAAEE